MSELERERKAEALGLHLYRYYLQLAGMEADLGFCRSFDRDVAIATGF